MRQNGHDTAVNACDTSAYENSRKCGKNVTNYLEHWNIYCYFAKERYKTSNYEKDTTFHDVSIFHDVMR